MNHRSLLPEYPRTPHLPHKPNATREDLISDDCGEIFTSDRVYVEDKVDGAQCGMMLYSKTNYKEYEHGVQEEHPIVRNRSQFLTKGGNKRTPARMQFSSVFNWFYDNKEKFIALNGLLGIHAGVYGEWMYARHGISYDKLPDLFLVYDIFDYQKGIFLETGFARDMLAKAGFHLVPLLHKGKVESFEQLEAFCQEISPFASERREGVYIKVTDGLKVTKRFKMVRQDFIQGQHWSDKAIIRNGLR